MVPRPEWRALPLVCRVHRDAGAALEVSDDARDALLQYGAPRVGVLGVFGPPATGKRLLLRTLLNASGVDFSVAPSARSDVLLWLWLPMDAKTTESCARIVLAGGGFVRGDNGDTTQPDKQQLALLLLLCSALAYNAQGDVDAQAVAQLAWLSQVAQLLRVQPAQDAEAVARAFPPHAPVFLWLARQFKLKWLRSADGSTLSPSAYLARALQEEPGYSQPVLERNTLRMYLETYFPVRDCVALGREVDGSSDATDAAPPSAARQTLRPQFLDALDQLYASYLSLEPRGGSQLPAKRLLGQEVSVAQFVDVLDTYVAALNDGEPPTMQLAASALAQQAIRDAFAQAESVYTAHARLEEAEDIAGAREVQFRHLRGLQTATAHVREARRRLPAAVGLDVLFQESWARWEGETQRAFEAALAQHASLSIDACETLLQRVLPRSLALQAAERDAAPRETFVDDVMRLLTQYKAQLTSALATYAQESRGSERAGCLERALLESVLGSVQPWGRAVLRQYRERLGRWLAEQQQLERRLGQAEMQQAETSATAAAATRQDETRLQTRTQELSELRRTRRAQLNASQAALAQLTQELATAELKHDVRVTQREHDLSWARSRTAEMETAVRAERQRKQALASAASELLDKERRLHREERSLLAQQQDAMAQVVALERQLASSKTAHAQRLFAVHKAHAKALDARRLEQAQATRELKTQAKRDVDVLRHGHETRKRAVEQERRQLEQQVAQVQTRLEALARAEQAARAAAAGRRDFFRSYSVQLPLTTTPPPADAAQQVASRPSASRTTSLGRSRSLEAHPRAETRAQAQQSQVDMCGQS